MEENFHHYSAQRQPVCHSCNGKDQFKSSSKKVDAIIRWDDVESSTEFFVETFSSNAVNAIQEGVINKNLPKLTDIYFGEDDDEFLTCNFVFERGIGTRNYKLVVLYLLSRGLACHEQRGQR